MVSSDEHLACRRSRGCMQSSPHPLRAKHSQCSLAPSKLLATDHQCLEPAISKSCWYRPSCSGPLWHASIGHSAQKFGGHSCFEVAKQSQAMI